ncbi:hypothetical protein BDW72DRAFT_197632 [Aspergillus terricola var. indicus]
MILGQKVVKGIAAGIGLASESISAHKASKQERKGAEERSSGLSEAAAEGDAQAETDNEQQLAVEQLEQEWRLDEAQDEMHQHNDADTHEQSCHDTENVYSDLSSWTHPQPPGYSASNAPRLPYPVILPQRRPKNNKRGFIRAYAPVLADFGIDQETFLNFLETSNKACQATPWLYALNLASVGTIWLPSAIAFVVSTVIQVGTEAAIQVDGRRKTNAYFDKINEEFFRPRGLYCLIMTWEPESDATFRKFDLNTAISTAVDQGGPGTLNKLKHRLKSSHGKTHNELPFPEFAPLVFPSLDAVAASGSEAQIENLKKREFLADYFDRRGQAKFAVENPTSALNIAPKPTFTSRYADPAHPASSGDLLSLVSGGHTSRPEIRPRAPRGRRGIAGGRLANIPGGNIGLRELPGRGIVPAVVAARQRGRVGNGSGRHNENHLTDGESWETGPLVDSLYEMGPRGESGRILRGYQSGHSTGEMRRGGLIGGAKKLLKSNVLYLMIVNMPSEEEMTAARAMFDE